MTTAQDVDGFTRLLPHIDRTTRSVCRRYSYAPNDDILQEARLRAWQAYSVRPEKKRLCGAVKHAIIDYFRRHHGRRGQNLHRGLPKDIPDRSPAPEIQLEQREHLLSLVGHLPPRLRPVLKLRLEGLGATEIAEELSTTRNTIYSYFSDIYRILRGHIHG